MSRKTPGSPPCKALTGGTYDEEAEEADGHVGRRRQLRHQGVGLADPLHRPGAGEAVRLKIASNIKQASRCGTLGRTIK